ncbi:RNA polymerase sigma factor, sigma-70 family [Opitutaceae bacterium TAV1]|nr:RNA polymerase sigma factor, sigma-70 family [Opitutaceae bacterium TAV1]
MADDALQPQPDDPAAVSSPPPDASSLKDLFLAEESRLLHFATGLTGGDFALAQDLVQDAFLRLHRATLSTADIPAAPAITQPRAWLFRTIRNLAHNHRRKHARVSLIDTTAHENIADPATAAPPAAGLERAESLLLMRLCLDGLPLADRELIRQKFENELSYDEIARRTGFTVSNVGYRLHHAIRRLAATFRHASDNPALAVPRSTLPAAATPAGAPATETP